MANDGRNDLSMAIRGKCFIFGGHNSGIFLSVRDTLASRLSKRKGNQTLQAVSKVTANMYMYIYHRWQTLPNGHIALGNVSWVSKTSFVDAEISLRLCST